jgi:hypothetical protein
MTHVDDAGIQNLARSNVRLHAKVAQLEKGIRGLVRRIGALEFPPESERIFDAQGPVRRSPGRALLLRGRGSNHSSTAPSSTIIDSDFDDKF